MEIDLGSDFEVDHVSGGQYHTCALSTKYDIKCFGRNRYGRLGYGHNNSLGDDEGEMGDHLQTVDLGDNFVPVQVDCGGQHSCALSVDHHIKCWGRNNYGQLGQGDTRNRGDDDGEMGDHLSAIDVGTSFNVSNIRSGRHHVCAFSDNDDVKCWGGNQFGSLGLGDIIDRGVNVGQMGDNLSTINFGTDFVPKYVETGRFHSIIISNGTLKAWGRNDHGHLGYGDTDNRGDSVNEMGDQLQAIDLGTGLTVTNVFASSCCNHHSCALLENGTDFGGLKCWGRNHQGQLGLNDTENRGDEANQMGDELPFVTFSPLFTRSPTISPTVNPTATTLDPTSYPTIGPTTFPSTNPTADPICHGATYQGSMLCFADVCDALWGGQSMVSANCQYALTMEETGNLVLYEVIDSRRRLISSSERLWTTNTSVTTGHPKFTFFRDEYSSGLVILEVPMNNDSSVATEALWTIIFESKRENMNLSLTDDGVLILYDSESSLWTLDSDDASNEFS